jgi:anti-sigma-K factor RskA
MRFASLELRELLAGQYVLGTLRGRARDRFQRLLLTDADLRRRTTVWEERLAQWLERLPPVAPRADVWQRLANRIAPPAPVAPVVVAPPLPPPPAPREDPDAGPGWWESLGFWRPFAGAALAASLALGIGLGLVLRAPPADTHAAVLTDAQGRPVWLLDARLPDGRLTIRAFPAAAPPPGKSYELWMIPGSGNPVSLGLLPVSGVAEIQLSAELGARVATAAGLAVSLEPDGGSPTGQPTGPIPYQTVLVRT